MATGDGRLIVSPLETLLLEVARRLHRERLAAAARYAAWGSVLVALVAIGLHVMVRPVSVAELLLGIALGGLVAAWRVFVTRTTPADCADWADRHLGGGSAYATGFEVLAPTPRPLAPAVAHLETWLARAVPASLATLAARPFDAGLRKPLGAATVCIALAFAMLQLPTRAHEPETTAAASRADTPFAVSPDGTGPAVRSATDAASTATELELTRPAQTKERGTPTANGTPVDVRGAAAQDERSQDGKDALAARIASRPSATGREAGDVADAGGENVFTAPAQIELAAQLREIALQAPRLDLRADASQEADFTGVTAAVEPAGGAALVAAPATPPPASASPPLPPAEQALLRAYWSLRRTNP